MARKKSPAEALMMIHLEEILIPEVGLIDEYKFAPGRGWPFDFALVSLKVAIEIEGGVWKYGRHNRATGFIKDMKKYNEAARLGWLLVRFTTDNVLNGEARDYMIIFMKARYPSYLKKRFYVAPPPKNYTDLPPRRRKNG